MCRGRAGQVTVELRRDHRGRQLGVAQMQQRRGDETDRARPGDEGQRQTQSQTAPTSPAVATTPAGRNMARSSRWLLRVTGLYRKTLPNRSLMSEVRDDLLEDLDDRQRVGRLIEPGRGGIGDRGQLIDRRHPGRRRPGRPGRRPARWNRGTVTSGSRSHPGGSSSHMPSVSRSTALILVWSKLSLTACTAAMVESYKTGAAFGLQDRDGGSPGRRECQRAEPGESARVVLVAVEIGREHPETDLVLRFEARRGS